MATSISRGSRKEEGEGVARPSEMCSLPFIIAYFKKINKVQRTLHTQENMNEQYRRAVQEIAMSSEDTDSTKSAKRAQSESIRI